MKEAIKIASQFDGYLLQSMLKSRRIGEHFLGDSTPFSSKNQITFQNVLDSLPIRSESVTLTGTLEKQPEHSAPPTLVDDFVKTVWPKAKQAASLIGLDPKILIAQIALETGWGKSIIKDVNGLSSHNLFNIKTGNNHKYESVSIKTTEYSVAIPVKMNESFRKYSSIEQSFNDYITLIKGSERYQNALASAHNPQLYVHELQKAGYASDPDYALKILLIYHGDELNQALHHCAVHS